MPATTSRPNAIRGSNTTDFGSSQLEPAARPRSREGIEALRNACLVEIEPKQVSGEHIAHRELAIARDIQQVPKVLDKEVDAVGLERLPYERLVDAQPPLYVTERPSESSGTRWYSRMEFRTCASTMLKNDSAGGVLCAMPRIDLNSPMPRNHALNVDLGTRRYAATSVSEWFGRVRGSVPP